jgi:pilus assembly protein CpaC
MRLLRIFMVFVLCCLLWTIQVFAAEKMQVGINQSRVFYGGGVTQVAVANPEIADVVIISSQQYMVVGKKAGSTTLHVWRGGTYQTFDVIVSGTDNGLAYSIAQLIGYPDVKVTVAGGRTMLEGTVQNQYERNRAEKIAASFGGEVVNLLEMKSPKQVRIESRIVEIDTDKTKDLGFTFANNTDDDDGNTVLGTAGSFGLGQSANNTRDGNNIFGWFGSYLDINAQLNALVKKGDAKILSQPYIITMSGEKAEILIGGEIPVPVNTDDNTVTVEWREYGIKLEIEPNVMQDNSVDSKIKTEVSTLDWSSSVAANGSNGTKIPGMRSRKADTHVQMRPGMTMAIGGLISSEESKSITKLPLLGDIPILGQFFRSTSKTRERKEIILLLTPILVDSDYKPIMSGEAARLSSLTDRQVLDGEVHEQPRAKNKEKK